MSGLCEFLEDFGETAASAPEATAKIDEAQIESERLAAFEEGYRAGWDDAAKAQTDDGAALSEGLRQSLQDVSFTYHEAYGHVMNAVAPLLEDMVQSLLPQMLRATLGAHIAQTLQDLARDIGGLDVELAVAPEMVSAVEPMVEDDFGFPLRLVSDASLNADQADLRYGESEKQIDLGDLMTTVTEAVHGFAHDHRRKMANG